MNSKKPIKSEIKKAVIKKIEAKIELLRERIRTGEEAINAENEENSDSRNNSLLYIQSEYIESVGKTQLELEEFEALTLESKNSVTLGSLVTVSFKAPSGRTENKDFFVSPLFGGTKINVEDRAISLVSPNSDFFKVARNKLSGDTFNLKVSTAKIKKIE